MLDHLRERSGLIVGPGTYAFVHKTVAEYLVAEATVQGTHAISASERLDRFALFSRRHEDAWNTVTFLWAGLAPASELEALIRECVRISRWPELALAAGLVLDQTARVSRALQREVVQALLSHDARDVSWSLLFLNAPGSWLDQFEERPGDAVIRGVATMWLEQLFEFAVQDRLLSWGDLPQSSSVIVRSAKVALICRAPFGDLETALRASSPFIALCGIQRRIIRCFVEGDDEGVRSHEVLERVLPELRGTLAYTLMAFAFVRAFNAIDLLSVNEAWLDADLLDVFDYNLSREPPNEDITEARRRVALLKQRRGP